MRIIVFKRKWATAAGCLCAAAAILWTVSHPAAVGAAAVQPSLPIYSVEVPEGEKQVALTFDAAWGDEDTEALIDILNSYEVPATFFVVGEWAQRCPDSVTALHEAGHEIMNHSDTHPHMTTCDDETLRQQVEQCNEKVEALTGVAPTLFRCPYGEYDDRVIATVRSMGMTPVQWSVDSLDWKGLSAGEITENVVSKAEDGSILLFHNGAEHTPEALPNVITILKNRGFRFVALTDLLLDEDYTIDSAGKQHPAQQLRNEGTASTE